MTSTFAFDRPKSRSDAVPKASTIDQMERVQSESDRTREVVFAELVDCHGRLMYKVAFSLLRNTQDAEDAVQTALLKLYRGDAWKQMRDAKAFLARTVWRVALDRLSKTKELPLEEQHEQILDLHNSPENNAIRNAQAEQLRKMIDRLPRDLRQVLLLSAIEELNSREVAILIGVPEGTVRTRLMRGRTQLRTMFELEKGDW